MRIDSIGRTNRALYSHLQGIPQLPQHLVALTADPWVRPTAAQERELQEHVWRIAGMIRAAREGLSDEQRRQMEIDDGSDDD